MSSDAGVAVRAPAWGPPLLAVQLLTRVPVPGTASLSAPAAQDALARSVVWFPVVGGLVGTVTAGVLLGTAALWPPYVAVVLALVVEARLTGALHEDAVADFCDAFGGGRTRERTFEILKDSRVGSYGVLGLVLALGLRAGLLVALLGALDPWPAAAAVVASAALGRWAAVSLMATSPAVSARPDRTGLARAAGAQTTRGRWALATAGAALLAAPWAMLAPWRLALVVAATLLVLLWVRRLVTGRLGGVTGDCLGFGVYATQLVVLLAATAGV